MYALSKTHYYSNVVMCFYVKREGEIRMYVRVEKLIRLRVFSDILRSHFLSL